MSRRWPNARFSKDAFWVLECLRCEFTAYSRIPLQRLWWMNIFMFAWTCRICTNHSVYSTTLATVWSISCLLFLNSWKANSVNSLSLIIWFPNYFYSVHLRIVMMPFQIMNHWPFLVTAHRIRVYNGYVCPSQKLYVVSSDLFWMKCSFCRFPVPFSVQSI